MSLIGLRSAIVADITSKIPDFHTVQAHGGTFDKDELKRIALKSPACLVALMGGPLAREGGSPTGEPTLFAFVVTGGSSSTKRNRAAIILVEEVIRLVANNSWKYECAQAPNGMRMDNLYSGEIDKEGVALWSVSWSQRTDIATFDPDDPTAQATIDANLADFKEMHFDIEPQPAEGIAVPLAGAVQLRGQFMSAYGHIFVSTPLATAIATADTYQKAAGTTTAKLLDEVDMPSAGRLRHKGVIAKPFMVTIKLSAAVDADAKVTFAIAKGGIVDEDTEIEEEMTVAGGAEAIPLTGIVSLDEDEYIEVWVKADDTVNVTLTKANVVLAAA